MPEVRVSAETRRLVHRLPPGRTRLSAPRLRTAYGLGALSRTERSRIARELHAAGLDVTGDAYGVIVSKPRDLRPGGLRVRRDDLRQAVPRPVPAARRPLAAVTGASSSAAPQRRQRGGRRIGPALVGVLAAAAAAVAAVGFGGPGEDPRAAGALSVGPSDARGEVVRTRVARGYGVRSTRALAAGDLPRARALLSAAHALPDVVEVQRASRSLARRERAVSATHQPR